MNVLELFKPIRKFVISAEGVLTDNTIYTSVQTAEMFHVSNRDAFAIQAALKKGYSIWIINQHRSEGLRNWLTGLGVSDVHFGVSDKRTILNNLMSKMNTKLSTVLYIADDISDYSIMKHCGMPCCPVNAVDEVKSISKYISPFKGGEGCVRDVIEKVMKLNGDWDIPA